MRRFIVRCGGLLVALLATVMWTVPASASGTPDDDVVRSLTVAYEIDETGSVSVTETYEWDFGDRWGLGFYRNLVVEMGWADDPSLIRVYEYSDFSASSASGAPAYIWAEGVSNHELNLAIGVPDGSSDTRTGVQSYEISYVMDGAINPIRGQDGVSDQDELYHNVFTNTPITVENVTVTVTGPADVVDIACYQGPYGSTTPCNTSVSSGNTATFTAQRLQPGYDFTIMAAYPAGTFSNPGPILEPISSMGSSDRIPVGLIPPGEMPFLDWVFENLLIVGGAWLGGLGLTALAARRGGRDRAFAGLPPGTMPGPGQSARQTRLTREPPVAVRFSPPDDLSPAEADVIEDMFVTTAALPATIVDLAVRGYLTITSLPDANGAPDWEFARNPNQPADDELRHHEDALLTSLFLNGRERVRVSELRGTFARDVSGFHSHVNRRAEQQKWFTTSKSWGPLFAGLASFLLLAAPILAAIYIPGINAMALVPVSVLAWAFVVSAIFVYVMARRRRTARSAVGRAYYEQIRGFKEYISTAEAHQLRWEEGEDIFSRYLPWAMVFGQTRRWTQLFAELAKAGQYDSSVAWFREESPRQWDADSSDSRTERHTSVPSFGAMGDSLINLTTNGMDTLRITPGSSGRSGSSSSSDSSSSRRSSSSSGSSGSGYSGGGGGGGSFGGR